MAFPAQQLLQYVTGNVRQRPQRNIKAHFYLAWHYCYVESGKTWQTFLQ